MANNLATLGFGRSVFQPEHDAFRETLRRFMKAEVEPNIRAWEKDGFFPAELFRRAGDAGLLCASIPQEYGGGGGDLLHHIVLHEEHCYTPAVIALEAGLMTDFVQFLLYDWGTEEQKKEYLPRFASGECIAEIGLSEPGAGSDAQGIKCFARRDGDDWILNGQKAWVTNGPILNFVFAVANTRTDGPDGKSIFIVPLDAKGVSRRTTDLMAKTCGGVAEIFFDDVRLPSYALLGGEEGNGLKASLELITVGRLATAARVVAACEAAIEMTSEYVKDRRAFGQAIFDFQNTRFKLASVATETAAARAFVDMTIQRLTQGPIPNEETAKLRLFTTEVEGRVMDECLQLHGGAGYSNEYLISKMYQVARVHRIYGGTSEIMREIIGRRL